MPDTAATVLSARAPLAVPGAGVRWVPVTYRRPVRRFVEAGAVAWVRDLEQRVPRDADWIASLECCSLVSGQVADLMQRRSGARQAVVTWENDPRQPLYSAPMFRRALRATLGTAALFLCMTNSAADHLRVLGVGSERIATVRPGVDLARFRPASTPVADPIVAFASPLIRTKGIDRVLDAMRIVRRRIPEARLRIMGTGPLESVVRAAQPQAGSAVEFLGSGDADAVAATLQQAAVFCTAPRANVKWSEQFGLAYLEAMACGLPIVTTATGTNHEALAPGNRRTVDRPDDLAQALLVMLDDPALRSVVGGANRAYVAQHHDLDTQCAAMAAAFAAAERHSPRMARW
jgi:glycosyltransferase involved in cell wall biosynthesis